MEKNTTIKFRVRDAEKERIRLAAATKGVGISGYIRAIVMRNVARTEKNDT